MNVQNTIKRKPGPVRWGRWFLFLLSTPLLLLTADYWIFAAITEIFFARDAGVHSARQDLTAEGYLLENHPSGIALGRTWTSLYSASPDSARSLSYLEFVVRDEPGVPIESNIDARSLKNDGFIVDVPGNYRVQLESMDADDCLPLQLLQRRFVHADSEILQREAASIGSDVWYWNEFKAKRLCPVARKVPLLKSIYQEGSQSTTIVYRDRFHLIEKTETKFAINRYTGKALVHRVVYYGSSLGMELFGPDVFPGYVSGNEKSMPVSGVFDSLRRKSLSAKYSQGKN